MPSTYLHISLTKQRLELRKQAAVCFSAPVSTALNGPGEVIGSGCTPRGKLRIRLKIGAGCPLHTVFVGRRPTGEIYTPDLAARYPARDWILTRILWLDGLELGKNRAGPVDTLRRFIYIHGCPPHTDFSRPSSHGCVRMRNTALLTLFEQVENGTLVWITDD